MAGNTASIWAAIAASFSALSSFLLMLVHRRNLLESSRPELILTNWDRKQLILGESSCDVISFKAIRNVGKGAALNITINHMHFYDTPITVSMPTIMIPIIGAGDNHEIVGEITISWKNIKKVGEYKHLYLNVNILCWDARNIHHETIYRFLVKEPSSRRMSTEIIAPGVTSLHRFTTSRPLWIYKILNKKGKYPNNIEIGMN